MVKKRKKKQAKKVAEKGLKKFTAWLKTQNPKDIFDVALNVALAYAGVEITKNWKGALIGPIGLKLATTPSLVPATAGVTTLGILGVCSFAGFESPEKAIAAGVPPAIAHAGKVCDDFLKGVGF